MPRKDYDEIKKKFGEYIDTWKSRNEEILDYIFIPQARIYLSTSKEMLDGSQHGLNGVKCFIRDFPKTDVFHSSIYNYVCRLKEDNAQQFSYVVCTALNYVIDSDYMDHFYFTAIFSNHWIRTSDNGWQIDNMKMDIYDQNGILKEYFENTWHFEESRALLKPGVHYPCIEGELDSPWVVIPDAEDVLTEEEKVKEGFYKYNYGIDQLAFAHCLEAISDSYNVSGVSHRKEGKRRWITNVKFNRQKARYWVHSYKFFDIEIVGDRAYVLCDRVSGQRQNNREYVWTREKVDVEHTSARCQLELVKEQGMWRLAFLGYYQGLYEVGKYDGNSYGDLV